MQTNQYTSALGVTAHRYKIPHIWRFGGRIEVCFPWLSPSQKTRFLKVFCSLSSQIICNSKFIKSQFNGIRQDRIHLIYNGVDFAEIDKAHLCGKLLKMLKPMKKTLKVGMVAHINPQKRHIDFIRAARLVKQKISAVNFIILGGVHHFKNNTIYNNFMRKEIKKLHLEKNCVLAGFYENTPAAIEEMDIIVMPSINESCSNAILEAMAKGKPIIAADSGGNPELVKDGVNGKLVPPCKPQKIADAIVDIYRNPTKAKLMGESGRKICENLFNIRNIARQYEDIYFKVLKNS
jgi:glycosyltransferase involved in cell wall biosynthesis